MAYTCGFFWYLLFSSFPMSLIRITIIVSGNMSTVIPMFASETC